VNVGLIVAMRREARPVLRRVRRPARGTIAGLRCWSFAIGSVQCVMILCGIGLERAKAATAALIQDQRPGFLISFGVGGGVTEELQVGDVVAADSVALLDDGAVTRRIDITGASPADIGRALHRGTVITTRGDPVSAREVSGVSHPVLDMETHGVAQEAARRGIPLLAFRSLSDSVREPLPFDLAAFTDNGYRLHTTRLLAWIVSHPWIAPRLSRLRRNTRIAAENAAAAVCDVLADLGKAGP
jgi:nucleoside phosphorylase